MSKIISSKYKLTIAQKHFKMIPRNESEDFSSLPKHTLKMKYKRDTMRVFSASSFCCRREHIQRPTARHQAECGDPRTPRPKWEGSINPSPQGSVNLAGGKSFIARDGGHQENKALHISATKRYRHCGRKPRGCAGALSITKAYSSVFTGFLSVQASGPLIFCAFSWTLLFCLFVQPNSNVVFFLFYLTVFIITPQKSVF